MKDKTDRLLTALEILTVILLFAALYLNIDLYHTLTGKWLPW